MPSLKRSLSCLLLCMLLLSASCSAKAKEFSKDGMHITRTDALLTCRNAFSGRRFRSGKIRLQRSHAAVDQKKTCIVVRNEREAGEPEMALAFKK